MVIIIIVLLVVVIRGRGGENEFILLGLHIFFLGNFW